MKQSDRRDFVKQVGGVALGTVVGSGATALLTHAATDPSLPPLPWTYVALDPVVVAERAYAAYYAGGCMYGAYDSIIGQLQDQVGAPFTFIPTAMAKYGSAGVAGWGTLCGALNGIASALYLVLASSKANPIINEVFGWYGTTPLPTYTPKNPKYYIDPTIAKSQLCHESVTLWCKHTQYKTTDPQRAERCAQLTASVAKYTVEMLNANLAGQFKVTHTNSASVASCLSCHGPGGSTANVHITGGQTSCTLCHHWHWSGGVNF
ncbi:MAG: C-GCAxxG-C-C family (seleno)protein [Acidobacteriia bacterium]|nr:C-GCAxxG-C-C family (seleno)protein [Terriglobia bacterium]